MLAGRCSTFDCSAGCQRNSVSCTRAIPRSTRKRQIEGTALKSTARLQVQSIDRMGIRSFTTSPPAPGTSSRTAWSATTASPARRTTTSRWVPARDFEREIVVKVNAPELLGPSCAAGPGLASTSRWAPHRPVPVGRGPLPADARDLEPLRDPAESVLVLTKSPLLLRDLDLLQELSQRTSSAPPLGPDARREGLAGHRAAHAKSAGPAGGRRGAQPGRASRRRAGGAVDAGINDGRHSWGGPRARREAGATSVAGIALHLRGDVSELFLEWLEANRPDLMQRYRPSCTLVGVRHLRTRRAGTDFLLGSLCRSPPVRRPRARAPPRGTAPDRPSCAPPTPRDGERSVPRGVRGCCS